VVHVLERVARRLREPSAASIVFVHVPRCGGTSVEEAIGGLFAPHQRFVLLAGRSRQAAERYFGVEGFQQLGPFDIPRFREVVFHYVASSGWPFVSGHFTVHRKILEQYGDRFRFVVILRDPV